MWLNRWVLNQLFGFNMIWWKTFELSYNSYLSRGVKALYKTHLSFFPINTKPSRIHIVISAFLRCHNWVFRRHWYTVTDLLDIYKYSIEFISNKYKSVYPLNLLYIIIIKSVIRFITLIKMKYDLIFPLCLPKIAY